MPFAVQFLPAAVKALQALPKDVQRRIVAKVERLADEPHPDGSIKLQGEESLWRVRIGTYRVVYTIDGDQLVVIVVRIGHRREVYRRRG